MMTVSKLNPRLGELLYVKRLGRQVTAMRDPKGISVFQSGHPFGIQRFSIEPSSSFFLFLDWKSTEAS